MPIRRWLNKHNQDENMTDLIIIFGRSATFAMTLLCYPPASCQFRQSCPWQLSACISSSSFLFSPTPRCGSCIGHLGIPRASHEVPSRACPCIPGVPRASPKASSRAWPCTSEVPRISCAAVRHLWNYACQYSIWPLSLCTIHLILVGNIKFKMKSIL